MWRGAVCLEYRSKNLYGLRAQVPQFNLGFFVAHFFRLGAAYIVKIDITFLLVVLSDMRAAAFASLRTTREKD